MFAARTILSTDPPASARTVDEQLESLRRRWNQHGIEALISTQDAPGGALVRYRLTIASGPADPSEVHAAFRDDLDRALSALADRLAAPPEPAAWDLESLAAAATRAARRTPTARVFQTDTDDRWP